MHNNQVITNGSTVDLHKLVVGTYCGQLLYILICGSQWGKSQLLWELCKAWVC